MINKKTIVFSDYHFQLINSPLFIQFVSASEISKDSFDDVSDMNLADVLYDDTIIDINEDKHIIRERNNDFSYAFTGNKGNKEMVNENDLEHGRVIIETIEPVLNYRFASLMSEKMIKPIHIKVYSDSMQKLNIISSNGNVTLNKGTINHFSLNALHGNVNLKQMVLQHNSSISCTNGNLTISYSSLGSFNLKNSNGRISLLSCPMIGGSICSCNGLISIDNSTVSNGTIIDSHNGTIKLSSTNFGPRTSISTYTGNMRIEKSIFGNDASFSSQSGDIKVSHCTFLKNPKICTDVGDIKLIHSESGATATISTDVGSISYEDCGYDKEEKRLFLSR